jgi:hypothetical protein
VVHQRREKARAKLLRELPGRLSRAVDRGLATSAGELGEVIADVLAQGIGADVQMVLRCVDQMEERDGSVLEVLDRLAVKGPTPGRWPGFLRREDGVAGQVWRTGKPEVVLCTREPREAERLAGTALLGEWLSEVGCLVCEPLEAAGRDSPFAGTICVFHAEPWALSEADVAFVRKVADQAGHALRGLSERREQLLRHRLLCLVQQFCQGVLCYGPPDGRLAEIDLLRGATAVLVDVLGEGAHQVWRVREDGLHLELIRTSEAFLSRGALLVEEVKAHMGEQPFVVVSNPATDERLLDLLPGGARDGGAQRQRAGLWLIYQGQPLALFVLAVGPDVRLSYTLVQRAEGLLRETLGPILLASRRTLH